jgi:hypothetical protein
MTKNTVKIVLTVIALGFMSSGAIAADQPIYGSQMMTNQERNIMSKCSLEPRNVALPYPIRRQLKVGVCVKAWVLAAGWVPVGEWVVVVEVADRK